MAKVGFEANFSMIRYSDSFTFAPPLQENYTGYEFEARLNFKVHSAMSLC